MHTFAVVNCQNIEQTLNASGTPFKFGSVRAVRRSISVPIVYSDLARSFHFRLVVNDHGPNVLLC